MFAAAHLSSQTVDTMTESLKLLIAIYLCGSLSAERTFDGFSVLRVKPENDQQLNYLTALEKELDGNMRYFQKTDFWRRPRALNETVDLMVSPELRQDFQTRLAEQDLKPSVMVKDVQQLLATERLTSQNETFFYMRYNGLRQNDKNAFFADYHRLTEIHSYMDDLARAYDHVTVENIGLSFEGKQMKLFRIGLPSNEVSQKPMIWVDGGIHAREWISPATVLFIATTLAMDSETDPAVKTLLETYDFIILPVSNPDGYEYTQVDRMWRKTRSRSDSIWDFVCRGVDPNRNWGFHWNEAGSSNNPCSDIYAGKKAFSEKETTAMSQYILRYKSRLAMYLSFHSYSQLVLTPWGWTEDLPEAYPDMERRALVGVKALNAKYGTEYKVGSSTRVLYAAAGGSDDWAHGEAKIKYSYTMELRDTGDKGFILPKEQIVPTGEETWEFFKTVALDIAEEYTAKAVAQPA